MFYLILLLNLIQQFSHLFFFPFFRKNNIIYLFLLKMLTLYTILFLFLNNPYIKILILQIPTLFLQLRHLFPLIQIHIINYNAVQFLLNRQINHILHNIKHKNKRIFLESYNSLLNWNILEQIRSQIYFKKQILFSHTIHNTQRPLVLDLAFPQVHIPQTTITF